MQKNYKGLVLSIIVVLLAGAFAFCQEQEATYKDVILDGKPAKLNTATGEITFVNSNDKKEPIKFDDYAKNAEVNSTERYTTTDSTDFYIVKKGETLFEIANQFNTSLSELKRANNLETTLVSEGQRLKIKNFETVAINTESKPLVEEESINEAVKSDYHSVVSGDTLYSLAKRYGLTVNQLKNQNGLTSNLIKPGQELLITNHGNNNELGHVSVWTVSKGDTLYSIAKENDVTVEYIKRLNGLTDNLIKIGQKLQLK